MSSKVTSSIFNVTDNPEGVVCMCFSENKDQTKLSWQDLAYMDHMVSIPVGGGGRISSPPPQIRLILPYAPKTIGLATFQNKFVKIWKTSTVKVCEYDLLLSLL